MKVLMRPSLENFEKTESGIKQVLLGWHRYGHDFGIQFVDEGPADITVVHAGASSDHCDVACLHGMYWSADYNASEAEYQTNARIVANLRVAKEITVPSEWTAETMRRDLRVNPTVIPHGIEWDQWQHSEPDEGYALWGKNRAYVDVCDPSPVGILAERFSGHRFLCTFAAREDLPNVRAVGRIPHADMKVIIQRAGVYLSLVKETFGIQTLEAMASGVPVLGWAEGGNLDLVEHGTNGYLAEPGNWDDLAEGFDYCQRYRAMLGANGTELVKKWTWPAAMEKLVRVFERAIGDDPPTVGVVIPVYNKPEHEVRRAVQSVIDQTYQPVGVVVIDDGSADGSGYEALVRELGADYDGNIEYRRFDNSGVAIARNRGIEQLESKYICCLDSDDWLEPEFLDLCVNDLEADPTLGIAYTGMRWHRPDGTQGTGRWPGRADANRQAEGYNQVPTCCVFRRTAWERTGGYRQRYAPTGAGSEDAELWLRMMAYGFRADEISPAPLFNYSWLSGQVSGNPNYREVNWLHWHPWTLDHKYPLAAVMTPPRHASHDVRQYDKPDVSIIIPVGPGHEEYVIDALDSLEAQIFRNWEAVVVWDAGGEIPDWLRTAYPYVHWVKTEGGKGAGFARNHGAIHASAPLLLWLDADDYLHPEALVKMLKAWNDTGHVIYTDIMGRVKPVRKEDRGRLKENKQFKKLVRYDGSTEEAWIAYRAYDFDCERALKQPEKGPAPYYWCYTTTLVPKAWHDAIGGYDEDMESWEDADYAFRLVRAGHCYSRVADELLTVRFYTGSRLRRGLQIHENLVQYIRGKYAKEGEPMPCRGCGGGRVAVPHSVVQQRGINPNMVDSMDDGDYVQVVFKGQPPGNRGGVKVIGRHVNPETGSHFDYGKRKAGDVIFIHKEDLYVSRTRQGQPVLDPRFEQVDVRVSEVKKPEVEKVETGAPEPLAEPSPTFDLQKIPGVGGSIARQLRMDNLDTPDLIQAAGVDGLSQIRGISPARAATIIEWLSSQ